MFLSDHELRLHWNCRKRWLPAKGYSERPSEGLFNAKVQLAWGRPPADVVAIALYRVVRWLRSLASAGKMAS